MLSVTRPVERDSASQATDTFDEHQSNGFVAYERRFGDFEDHELGINAVRHELIFYVPE